MLTSLSKELPGALLNFLGTLAGVWLAFFLTNLQIERSDKSTFAAMNTAIASEARANLAVEARSKKDIEKGNLTLQDFSAIAAQQALANPTFVKYAGPNGLANLNHYIRDVATANVLRAQDADYQLRVYKGNWQAHVQTTWGQSLDNVSRDVDAICVAPNQCK